jgi:RNA polymerase sigma-70 factor (ECF subfamily)
METIQTEPCDAELVKCLQTNDLSALGVLFDRYYAQIYRTALAITHDDAVAEDITQDCFLRLHRYANRIDTTLPLPPWLYRVTVNLAYTWVARHKKRRVSLETVVDYLMSPARSTPDHVVEVAGVQEEVRQAIADLNFNQRVVVVLHYLNGLSLEDIAHILDCPVGTVKSRLYYARENLRHRLVNINGEPQVAHGYTR